MSAARLGDTANNRAHTPGRFLTLNSEDGKVILNINFITNFTPIPKGHPESGEGLFSARAHMINGQVIRVREETSVIAQILSADGLHGTSR